MSRGGKREGAGRKPESFNLRKITQLAATDVFTRDVVKQRLNELSSKDAIDALLKIAQLEPSDAEMIKLEIFRRQADADIRLKEKQINDGVIIQEDSKSIEDVFARMAKLDKVTAKRLKEMHEIDEDDED